MPRSRDPRDKLPAQRGAKRTGPIGTIVPGDEIEVARDIQRAWLEIGRLKKSVAGLPEPSPAVGGGIDFNKKNIGEWFYLETTKTPSPIISSEGEWSDVMISGPANGTAWTRVPFSGVALWGDFHKDGSGRMVYEPTVAHEFFYWRTNLQGYLGAAGTLTPMAIEMRKNDTTPLFTITSGHLFSSTPGGPGVVDAPGHTLSPGDTVSMWARYLTPCTGGVRLASSWSALSRNVTEYPTEIDAGSGIKICHDWNSFSGMMRLECRNGARIAFDSWREDADGNDIPSGSLAGYSRVTIDTTAQDEIGFYTEDSVAGGGIAKDGDIGNYAGRDFGVYSQRMNYIHAEEEAYFLTNRTDGVWGDGSINIEAAGRLSLLAGDEEAELYGRDIWLEPWGGEGHWMRLASQGNYPSSLSTTMRWTYQDDIEVRRNDNSIDPAFSGNETLPCQMFFVLSHEGHIRVPNIPTSATGLPAGTLWNNGGTLSVA